EQRHRQRSTRIASTLSTTTRNNRLLWPSTKPLVSKFGGSSAKKRVTGLLPSFGKTRNEQKSLLAAERKRGRTTSTATCYGNWQACRPSSFPRRPPKTGCFMS